MKKGQDLGSGFSVIETVQLAEMNATGIWARHECGAEVFHILNDDCENLFAFAFATAQDDDTGVAHILEHAVLCGSERFPLKDAFITLAQGSLQTFLNAMTYPDKTVYPASSVNESDYFNLMSVYGDAVFRPLLSRWSFMQEGHRMEIEGEGTDERLSVTGVVYNEMKGAYSSLDEYAGRWSTKSVLPDTAYGFDSGGDPAHIPSLTWEGLKDFHARRYSPANCRVFLAGNIPTEKQLAFLHENFFRNAGSSSNDSGGYPQIMQERWTAPREYVVPCPAGGDSKPTVFVSWLCCDSGDAAEVLALSALGEVLLGHDGSPLLRALIESGLGEDICPVTGLDSDIAQAVFTVGLRGVRGGAEGEVAALVMREIARLADDGLPSGEIDAAMQYLEFSQREIQRSGGPFSLMWMSRSLRGWMHGGKPWDTLLFAPAMVSLRGRLAADARYFENLLRKYFLDNPHRARVVVEPRRDFLPEMEARLAESLARSLSGMGAAERLALREDSAALERAQSEGDSAEALATIPHLSRGDLSPELDTVPRSHADLGGVPALLHDIHTNGISYVELAFPLDLLPPEDYVWVPFLGQAATSVGLPGMDYAEVSSLLASTVGGFNFSMHAGSAVPPADEGEGALIRTACGALDLAGRDWMFFRMKCLDEKVRPSLDLVLRLVSEADFSDRRRMGDLVLEMKSQSAASLAPNGSAFALARANRGASAATLTGETWGGLTQLLFAQRLAEMDTDEVIAKLEALRAALVSGGLIANLTGSAAALGETGAAVAERFGRFGPPKPRPARGAASAGIDSVEPIEVFASPSLQVGFAAAALRAAPFDSAGQMAEAVLANRLSAGELWEDIRMKGGAYGAWASGDSLEGCFSLASYRDPMPLRSLETFGSVLRTLAADFPAALAEGDLVKAIIGSYARETRPNAPAVRGASDFLRFVTRIDDDYRRRKLRRLIGMTASDVTDAVRALAAQEPFGRAVIAGAKDAEAVAKAMGTEVRELPV